MAKTAEIKTKLTGDATGLRRELDVSRSDVARYARDVTARLKAIQAAVQSINLVAGVAGFVAMAKQAIRLYEDLRKWIKGTSEEAEAAAAKATEAARKLRDEAGEGVGVALYDALREQAEAAGVAADALSAKLREFREHRITFDELAASVGATRDALAGAESAAAGRTVGTRYLVDKGDAEAARKAREDAAGTEREGLRAIVRDIYANGDKFGRGVDDLWDRLLEAAGGDAGRAGELYNQNRGWTNFRAVGVGLYGDEALRAASGRHAARQAAAEAAREAERQAHDAEVRAQREAAAKAEEERRRLENERAAAAAEAERQRAEAQRQREEAAAQAKADKIEKLEDRVIEARWRGQRAEEAVRVSAPSAINSLNSIGGLVGSDPAALNAARMEAERTAAVNAIRESTAAAVRALEEEIRILREG